MRLKFKQQKYQSDATESITNLFLGQSKGLRKEMVGRQGFMVEEIFSNKKLELSETEILNNLQLVQKQNALKVSKKLEGLNFTVEMETGTGKTYVYTKTMFELNKLYGWSKFIVLVPSVAIREGVNKSLEITSDHFQEIYGKRIRFSIYNTQNKSNLNNIKSFANTSNIEVIIMNYQAFATNSKESRKIFQKLDGLQSEKPIDIIKRSRPILIVDEPQRFGNSESMFHEFNPLFILRYSATHKADKEYNKVYSLDAIDAFNQKLVKKISVKGIEVVGNSGTNSFLFLDRINISKDSFPTANIELEVKQQSGIKKSIRRIKETDDLFQLSGELQQYKGFVVKEINGLSNKITFINGVSVGVGQTIGDVDEVHLRRIQIRETIKSHLEKEQTMFSKGIKVLSLFFIDEVSKYKTYDDNSNEIKGDYAKIFEEEYEQATGQKSLFNQEYNAYLEKFRVNEVHNGYFSIDKKGRIINSTEKRGSLGSDDVNAYDLIMKNKERLLSFEEPTRFIFSHSALREGWDNPNVFQICTLKHSQSTISKRQEIGRGLRISVNNDGDRMDFEKLESNFFEVNTLTVIASESYDNFARELQTEILDSLSDRPIKLTVDVLKNRILKNTEGTEYFFDDTKAMNLIFKFRENGYLSEDYTLTEKLIKDIDNETLLLPSDLKEYSKEVSQIMKKIYDTATFTATSNEKADNVFEKELKPNDNFAKKEFQELWSKIKVMTVYDVSFESNELISKSVEAINKELEVRKVIIKTTEGGQVEELTEELLKAGESMTSANIQTMSAKSILGNVKYDLISEITKGSNITRQTAVSILQKINSNKFELFQVNPEDFIQKVVNLINQEKATTLINNITYSKINSSYGDEIFTINNFQGSLQKNILEVKKHIYDYVKTDSEVERKFANDMENGEILVYAKLPSGFKIPTPVGNYNPDWAIVFDTTDVKYIYFIAETKGSMSTMDLKKTEELKIEYARKHFESLGNKDIKYDVITTYDDLRNKVMR